MNYRKSYFHIRDSFYKSITNDWYEKETRPIIENLNKVLAHENELVNSLAAERLADWVKTSLGKLSLYQAFEKEQVQALLDMVYLAHVSFNVRRSIGNAEPNFSPADLFKLFCVSYILEYKKGIYLFGNKLAESEIFNEEDVSGRWSSEIVEPDYLNLVFNLFWGINKGEIALTKSEGIYDKIFANDIAEESIVNVMCQNHILLAVGSAQNSEQLDCPFGFMVDSLFPYEILAFMKLYKEVFKVEPPIIGDDTYLVDDWLNLKVEVGSLKDATSIEMLGLIERRFGRYFLVESID